MIIFNFLMIFFYLNLDYSCGALNLSTALFLIPHIQPMQTTSCPSPVINTLLYLTCCVRKHTSVKLSSRFWLKIQVTQDTFRVHI